MKRRNIKSRLEAALLDTPVVLLNGARQTGKTTLVRKIAQDRSDTSYFTLDDAATLAAATSDPAGFLAGLEGLAIIDEVQKAPGLLPAMKIKIDRDRQPGRFLLTGSADVLMLPQVSESLAGRMEIFTLWPFSQGEIDGSEDGLADLLFEEKLSMRFRDADLPSDWMSRVLAGGFPEAVRRKDEERRNAWFASYISSIIQRDIRDLSNIESSTEIPRLLSLIAARTGSLMNKSEISRSVQLPYTTLNRYFSLLELTFLVNPLPAWSSNLSKRLTRSAKLHLCDPALTAHLCGLSQQRLEGQPQMKGPLLENFVVMELRKQASWARTPLSLFHYRTTAGQEVDLVLEDKAGRIAGLEVKASSNLTDKSFKGLRDLKEAAGKSFHRGVILYTGESSLPFGEKFCALPVSSLWRLKSKI